MENARGRLMAWAMMEQFVSPSMTSGPSTSQSTPSFTSFLATGSLSATADIISKPVPTSHMGCSAATCERGQVVCRDPPLCPASMARRMIAKCERESVP
eukprot:4838321-Pyramimonas_sp.AAC.1